MNKKVLIIASLVMAICATQLKAQLNVGSTTKPDASAILQLSSTTQGLRMPNVSLTNTTTFAPVVVATSRNEAIGLTVYSATAPTSSYSSYPATGAGIYVWDGTGWVSANAAVSVGMMDLKVVGSSNHISQGAGFGSNGTDAGSGFSNIGIGSSSLSSIANGHDNIAMGYVSLAGLTSGFENIALGYSALSYNTVSNNNVAIGTYAMGFATGSSNNICNNNVAIGKRALAFNRGNDNVSLGSYSLTNNGDGYSNTAVGSSALILNMGGNYNTALGDNALSNNDGGDDNIAIGRESLSYNANGSLNTAVGGDALLKSTGNRNVALGGSAGAHLTSGVNNIALGTFTELPSNTGSNQLNIASCIFGINLLGSVSAPQGLIGINNTAPVEALDVIGNIQASGSVFASSSTLTSDVRLKKDILPVEGALDNVMKLKAVSYKKKQSIASNKYNMDEMGFVAQDLRKIFPQLVVEGADADKTLSVNYVAVIPVLTKAIQEQQAEILELKKQNTSMTEQLHQVADLQVAMRQLQGQIDMLAVKNAAPKNIASK